LRTARLVAQWQAVGFAHGVLNTDNMSILGLTLDYGPFGFMEVFDPGFICNHSDELGRYAFDRQAEVCYWNLACLAQALLPLVPKENLLENLNKFGDEFNRQIHQLMCAKLGLRDPTDDDRDLSAQCAHGVSMRPWRSPLTHRRDPRRRAESDDSRKTWGA